MNVLITQSMLFPWVGLLEQVNLADVIVHYDDVQFSKGSFTNRVQIKTEKNFKWMTVPLEKFKLGTTINNILINQNNDWKERHISLLEFNYKNAQFKDEMLKLVKDIYKKKYEKISDLSRDTFLALLDYFDLRKNKVFLNIENLNIAGKSSDRVLKVVKKVGGKNYISGNGGINYIDHNKFEDHGVKVFYMKYNYITYKQLWGEFNPFVSALDLIANCGKDGRNVISSKSIYWKSFLNK